MDDEFDEAEATMVFDSDRRRDTLQDVFPGAPQVNPIEIVFDRDQHPAGEALPNTPYRALEIWTQNRVYVIDSTLTCSEVISRKTGKADPKHSMIGARLGGGQRQYGKTVHVARPFPVPGTEAVFERPGRRTPAGVTSKVERVVLRIRVTSVVLQEEGAWDDVTSALLHPDFGHNR